MKSFSTYMNESLVDTDATESRDFLSMVRGALADEQSAINLYEKILKFAKDKEDVEVLAEIQADEKNHTGKLLHLIQKYDPNYHKIESGMENEE